MVSRPRPYWKGYLRLSLVSINVELYAASTTGEKTALHQIHKPTGQRVRYEKTVPGVGAIDTSDIVKGFEIAEDRYVVLEPDELDQIKLESRRTIELVQFVEREQIDPRYFEKPYYLVPEGSISTEGYLVVCEALRSAGKIGIGQMTMRGRENLVAIAPYGKGLLVETLRYGEEVRDAAEFFDDIPQGTLDREMVALASELISRKTKPFDASLFHDSYAKALAELVERKRAGRAIVETEPAEPRTPAKVIDLMQALRNSLAGRGTATSAAVETKTARPKSAKSPGRTALARTKRAAAARSPRDPTKKQA